MAQPPPSRAPNLLNGIISDPRANYSHQVEGLVLNISCILMFQSTIRPAFARLVETREYDP
jgi:hypothetical protein